MLEVDRVTPKSDGGADACNNLTLLCPPCNRAKRNGMTLSDFRASNARILGKEHYD